MKDNYALFELIRSLTETEKKFFKTYVSKNAVDETSRYILLFDVMNGFSKKTTEYDEKKVKKNLGNVSWLKNLSYVKTYLFNSILESQRAYKSSLNVNQKIKNILIDADFLIKKGLFQRAFEMLDEAEKLSEKYEKNTFLLEVINMKSSIFTYLPYEDQKSRNNEFKGQIEKTKKSLVKVKNQFYFRYHSHIFDYQRRTDPKYGMKNKISSSLFTIQGNKLSVKHKPLTFKSEYILYHLLWYCYSDIKQARSGYDYISRAVNLFDQNPQFIEEDPRIYLQVLHNFLAVNSHYHQVEQLNETINKIKAHIKEGNKQLSEHHKNSVLLFINICELVRLNSDGLFTQANKELIFRKKQFDLSAFQPSLHLSQGFWWAAAYACFGGADHRSCLRYCKKVEEITPDDQFPEGVRKARLYELLIHLDRKDHDLVMHSIRSFEYLTANLTGCDALEKELIFFARKWVKLSSTNKPVEPLYKELKNNILKRIEESPDLLATLQQFDILSWANSKLSGKTFEEEVRIRAKKYSPAQLLEA